MADAAPQPDPPLRKPRAPFVPHTPRWYQRVAAALIFLSERLVTATFRSSWDSKISAIRGPVIFCLWHNRLASCMHMWRYYHRRYDPDHGLAALISASKDGALLAATLEQFGVQPVRGSSSRRGGQALMELTSTIERGNNVAITPDGPRGPRYQVHLGVIALAQLTGAPIIPVSTNPGRKITFKSWDRFQLPIPFTRCEVVIGQPLHIPREATDEQREGLRQELEQRMMAITKD